MLFRVDVDAARQIRTDFIFRGSNCACRFDAILGMMQMDEIWSTAMDEILKHDLDCIDRVIATTSAYAVETLRGLDEKPVTKRPVPTELRQLPEAGLGFEAALKNFQARWAPGFSASAGPRYLGFVTGGATPAAMAGDWITSVMDQNPTASIDSTAPDLERETVSWLAEMFGISKAHTGSFVSGATMSNMVGLAIGREWLGEQSGVCISEEGVGALGRIHVLSGAAHSSVYKALSMLGAGRQALQSVSLLPGREAVDVNALEAQLAALDGDPAIVVANAGTVNTVDFDDLAAIVELKSRYRFWLHVDAAFGGFAALTAQHASLVRSLDDSDSVCIDCHKWLNVPYDSALQFTKRQDLQVRVFQNNASYLGAPTGLPDFVHLTPENSRRLRALAAWFSLSSYGRAGHRDIVQRNLDAASELARRIEEEPRLALLAPVRMNVVCFTLADGPDEARIQGFATRLRDAGQAFLTPTVLRGTWGMRAAFSNWRTVVDDVTRIFEAIAAAL
ncbi:glutamate/tyrosine decarboxylase-like PLP-dependent enzyme [Paraburkholderia sp. GAS199]|uniref:pyridoxal phosphate-dependent decarboxylase family protein n=1 Tax=Paraburkholderia sp. GAS199 TaxID=3035126 RepID=UPI003D1BC5BE